MNETVSRFIADLSAYMVVLPLLVGSLRLAYLRPVQLRLLVFIIISVCFEVFARTMGSKTIGIGTNLPLLHIFTLVQFLLIVNIFKDHLKRILTRTQLFIGIGFFSLFVLVNAIWIDGILNFNPHARAMQSLLLLFLGLSYFYRLLREMQVGRLEREPLFWISTAVLIYFSGALLIFIVSEYISNSQEVMLTAWGIHGLLNIGANILYAVALWVKPQK